MSRFSASAWDEAITEMAKKMGLQARALDKNFSSTNDLEQPWGLMCLGVE